MLYRVQCVDKVTGAQSDRIYRAEAADRAAEMALREGYIVGHVYPEAGVPMAAPQEGRLASYEARKGSPAGLWAFLNFEVFFFPTLVRIVFAISLGLTLVVTVAAPVYWLFFETDRSGSGAMQAALVVGWSWLWLIGLRIAAELWIVFFSVHEQLREINANTRPQK